MIERELKLAVPPRFRLPPLNDAVEGLHAVPLEAVTLTTAYYDTPELRLIRWGCTLRHRDGEGWNVKLPSEADGRALARPELVFEGSPRRPPPAALDVVRAYVRGDALAPVARMRTVRETVELRDARGTVQAEVVADEVSVLDGRRVAERFHEVEVELRPGAADSVLDAVADALEASGARVAEPTPKLVRALGPRALAPPELVVPRLSNDASAGELVTAALSASVVRFLRHDPGVATGEDPEDVHQARVALRRLRSDLRTFRPLLERGWAETLSREAAWFAGLLGQVRDAEVLRGRLDESASALAAADGSVARALLAKLDARRNAARTELLAARREPRFVALVERLLAAARSPALTPFADTEAQLVAASLVARPAKRMRKAAAAAGPEPSDDELHRLRILAKRVRYAAEAASPVLGKRAARLARRAAAVQDVLGEHQDAIVAQEWLRQAGRSSARRAFVAGELSAFELRAAARERRRWPRAWARASRELRRPWVRRPGPALEPAASPEVAGNAVPAAADAVAAGELERPRPPAEVEPAVTDEPAVEPPAPAAPAEAPFASAEPAPTPEPGLGAAQ